jgi:hypothetical protein
MKPRFNRTSKRKKPLLNVDASWLGDGSREFVYGVYLGVCRGDDLRGMPRVVLSAGWHSRNLHGSRTRRPAPPEGPATLAAGWRLRRGEPEPGDEDKNPPAAASPKVA